MTYPKNSHFRKYFPGLLLLLLVTATSPAIAQPWQLTFSGSGAATAIDSVSVTNLNLNSTLMMPGNDILILDILVNTGKTPEILPGKLSVYPNPGTGKFRLGFLLNRASAVHLQIIDIRGNCVAQLSSDLNAGYFTFEAVGLNAGIYFAKLTTGGEVQLAKILSLSANSVSTSCHLTLVAGEDSPPGVQDAGPREMQLRTGTYHYMTYHAGERLLIRAWSGNFSTISTLVPSQSQTLNIPFLNCTDADSNHYPVVFIGNQVWMAENLRTTHFRNSDTIQQVTGNSVWSGMSGAAFCHYNNAADSSVKWGCLYNGYAASDPRNIAPAGWRVPSNTDFNQLSSFLGGDLVAGGKMKQTGTLLWMTPNTAASNQSGFTGIPSGDRNQAGNFSHLRTDLALWSCETNEFGNGIFMRIMNYTQERLYNPFGGMSANMGYSVRCLYGEVPVISFDSLTDITSHSAKGYARVVSEGTAPVTERGFCWGLSHNPTKNNAFIVSGNGSGSFSAMLSGLMSYYYAGDYYVRAYAINAYGITYSHEIRFLTLTGNPFIEVAPATNITAYSATTGGTIDTTGGFATGARGVCWKLYPLYPYVYDSATVDGSGTGTFTSQLSGLIPGKKYYVRAYTTNACGTFYSMSETFVTPAVLPELTTGSISGYTYPTAASGGNITYDGGDTITARGVCWATHHNPTLSDAHTTDGSGPGTFTSSISGTSNNTTYYVRAYATNSAGTAYGNEVVLQTALQIGQPYQGGVVAYILLPGNPGYVPGETHGLITSVQSSIGMAEWGCWSQWVTTSENMGTAAANTAAILAACSTPGIAARLCNDYTSSGYTDWSLPSKTDLIALFDNRNATGYIPGFYWSSSQSTNSGDAWGYNFYLELLGTSVKGTIGYVRPIRYF